MKLLLLGDSAVGKCWPQNFGGHNEVVFHLVVVVVGTMRKFSVGRFFSKLEFPASDDSGHRC